MTITPETDLKIKFGLWGFIAGACGAMLIGFNWAGWTTSSTTQKISQDAVLATHAAICVARFMSAPNFQVRATELRKTDDYKRSEIIEKDGWDRMPGQEKADWGVSTACAEGLAVAMKTGA